jgi:hypothetical protein
LRDPPPRDLPGCIQEDVMVFVADCRTWAEDIFGGCDLGDVRRVDRLIDYAARQASDPAGSTSRACKGDPAAHQGAYKLLRNENVRPEDIEDGAFDAVAEHAAEYETVLAIQDSTGASFKHPIANTLASGEGNPTGCVVHSTLLVNAEDAAVIGVVDQERWIREAKQADEKPSKRSYREKESFKWEAAQERVRHRIADMSRVISVCDREADIFDYLKYMKDKKLRFVQRASSDRSLETTSGRLWETVENSPELGQRLVVIQQRGGQLGGKGQQARWPRRGREASATIRSAAVVLKPPRDRRGEEPIKVNAVLVREENPPAGESALEWMLLTTEPASTFAEATRVVEHYEKRWLIEEFHKAWKSGCRMEHRPLQSPGTLERMMVITTPIAVRLLQLRSTAESCDEANSEVALEADEWQCLWSTTQHKAPPKKAPSARWAFETIARLGGWQDTKRTGRVGWPTLWRGWDILQERLVAWRAASTANAHRER